MIGTRRQIDESMFDLSEFEIRMPNRAPKLDIIS